eukprot:GFUD01139090.1.p1 GENE.GFUD01139090.1~~GFUD01139090.1.p1  ORF type:complete len:282 (+),score=73.54 GFUD01139090.1:41-886(+)
MGASKRKRNVDCSERNHELVKEIKRDSNKVLKWVPAGYVSRKEAMRKHKLTEDDLKEINNLAVYAEKRGQGGLYYPPGEIRALVLHKSALNEVDENMISEATLVKQLKQRCDKEFMEFVRRFAARGSRSGHRGRMTHFYSVAVIEEHFRVKIISAESTEGEDFIRAQNVPVQVRVDLPVPPLCIWTTATGRAERCFVEPDQIRKILDLAGTCGRTVRKSERRRAGDEPPEDPLVTPAEIDADHMVGSSADRLEEYGMPSSGEDRGGSFSDYGNELLEEEDF